MDDSRSTDDRILTAFLQLAYEQGLEGVSTRELAKKAGVNPATLFRRFSGGKHDIILEAVRRLSPAPALTQANPGINPDRAGEGLVASLLFLAELVKGIRFGWLEGLQNPEVRSELSTILVAAYEYLRRALAQAGPALRPEVDHHAAVLGLLGMLIVSRRLGIALDEAEPVTEDRRPLFTAAVRPLLLTPGELDTCN
ncbi:MAG TPA: TetR/AcrR family transcriptional regulator [Symbiobacteriaceae bacterium]|nr:TetR/AcrR family transcriptional regulator [Symbiobacteriaceae bacterium]